MDLIASLDQTFQHAHGVIAGVGPELIPPEDADTTDRLVAYLGRTP
jgi:hypothetical protein